MRTKLFLLVSLLTAACTGAYGRERAWGYCEQGAQTALVTGGISTSTTTPLMRSYPLCTVTVYITGTLSLATLYSDDSGTPKANPFTANSFGYWFWYANNGRYDVKLSGAGLPSPFTLGDIQLADPNSFSAGVTSAAGTANQICVNQATGNVTFSICTNPTLPGTTTGTFVGGLTGNASTSSAFNHTPVPCSAGFTARGVNSVGDSVNCTAVSSGTGDVSSNTSTSVVNEGVLFADTTGKLVKRESGTGVVVSTSGVHSYTTTTTPIEFFRSKPNVTGTVYEFKGLPTYEVRDYNFPAQLTGNIAIGANTVTFTPCPLGLAGTDANHYLRLTGGTGTAETVLINGGTCTSGAASGTVGFTAANVHSGAVGAVSASGGIREAILASGGNAVIHLTPNTVVDISGIGNIGLVIDKSYITILGDGYGSELKALANEGLSYVIQATSADGLKLLNFSVNGNRANAGTNPVLGAGLNCGVPGVGGCSHVVIQDMQFYLSALFGVLINDSSIDVKIERNWIHHNGGVTDGTGAGQGVFIYHVNASGNALTKGVWIKDNYFNENHNTITNAHVGGSVSVIASDAHVVGNVSINDYNNGGSIVYAMGPKGGIDTQNGPVTIDGNTIIFEATALDTEPSGIEVDAGRSTISNNTMWGGWRGIALEGNALGFGGFGASDTVIVGNTMINPSVYCLGFINAGGAVRGTTVVGNRCAQAPAGFVADSATAATIASANMFLDVTTPIQDSSTYGMFLSGNYPNAANLQYTVLAAAGVLNMRCNQTAKVSGSATIGFIVFPSDMAGNNGKGCFVTLIPDTGSTWSTGTGGNIGIGQAAVDGQAFSLVSDGTLFNPVGGLALPALTSLQYYKGNLYTGKAEATAFPFVIASQHNFTPQQTGGTISAGSTTKTFTPCPLGVGGSDLHHYLYISGGTGTAEAVLITGGTCTSNAASGTIVFTAANAHSGAYTIGSASGGVFEAMNTLPVTGGVVQLPRGTVNLYQTLIIGQATAIAQSTINGITLQGEGSGRAVDIAIPIAGGTELKWQGPAGGTVVKVLGPIGNVGLKDIQINGNEGLADIGLDILHSYLSVYLNLGITGWNAVGLRSMAAAGTFPLMVAGNNSNRFDTVEVSGGYGGAANIACLFGQATVVGMTFDFASNTMINSVCLGGAGIGANIRFADNNSWLQTTFNGDIAALKFTSPGAGGFPANNVFIQSPLLNLLTSSAGFVAISPNFFYPLTTGEYPQDLEAIAPFAAGTDAYNIQFGHPKRHPLYYAVVTSPSAIANTVTETAFGRSYAVAAGAMNERGATVCIKAAGRLSTTGTPTINFRFKLGALTVGRFPFTTFNNSSLQPFALNSCMTTAVIGAGGNFLMGDAIGIIGGVNARTSEITGSQALDFTVAKTLTLTVEWGAADPANTVTLDNMRFNIEYPVSVE